jgi:hypothetical protein
VSTLDPRLILVIAMTAASLPAQSPSAEQKPSTPKAITVCELLKNVAVYRGKIVNVRGIYWNGLRQSCLEPFVTGSHAWPSALDMIGSRFPVPETEPAAFRTDQKSWDELDAFVLREAKAGHREEIWVSIIGLVRAPKSYIREDGQVVGGYGHLGGFPAQLVVQRVSKMWIKQVPTYDYGQLAHARAMD